MSEAGSGRAGVAVVTGASRGLGRGIAVALAAAGWDVVVGYGHRADEAAGTVAAIEQHGRCAVTVAGDVADRATAEALLAAAESLGGLDAWVARQGCRSIGELVGALQA